MSKKKITKDMTFAEIIELDSDAREKLAEMGLSCGSCPMSQLESLEDGAIGHGIDVDEILERFNEEE